jgi:hypothetical protein
MNNYKYLFYSVPISLLGIQYFINKDKPIQDKLSKNESGILKDHELNKIENMIDNLSIEELKQKINNIQINRKKTKNKEKIILKNPIPTINIHNSINGNLEKINIIMKQYLNEMNKTKQILENHILKNINIPKNISINGKIENVEYNNLFTNTMFIKDIIRDHLLIIKEELNTTNWYDSYENFEEDINNIIFDKNKSILSIVDLKVPSNKTKKIIINELNTILNITKSNTTKLNIVMGINEYIINNNIELKRHIKDEILNINFKIKEMDILMCQQINNIIFNIKNIIYNVIWFDLNKYNKIKNIFLKNKNNITNTIDLKKIEKIDLMKIKNNKILNNNFFMVNSSITGPEFFILSLI